VCLRAAPSVFARGRHFEGRAVSTDQPQKKRKPIRAAEVCEVAARLLQRKTIEEISIELQMPVGRVERCIKRMRQGATLGITRKHVAGVLTPAVAGLLEKALRLIGEAIGGDGVKVGDDTGLTHNQLQRYTETLLRAAAVLSAMQPAKGGAGGPIEIRNRGAKPKPQPPSPPPSGSGNTGPSGGGGPPALRVLTVS
jgi:hypothetical protein